MSPTAVSCPLVSVVIPAYRAAATLPRALNSVTAQTYTAWEAIVVDDAGGDGTAGIVASFGDSRVRLLRRADRGGPARARNDAIAVARGDLIAFLDADDEWLPEKLERQVAAMTADPANGLVVCDMRAVYPDGSEGLSVFARQAPAEGPQAWKALLASSFIGTSSVLTRRDLVVAAGGFDPDLAVGEDQDLFIKLALRGKVVALAGRLAIYHYSAASYSQAYAAAQAGHVLRMVRRHLALEAARLTRAERRRILARRYGRLGRNLVAAGARGRGAAMILGAAVMGNVSPENLRALARSVLV
jgi:glycosyltransferase involved in cell wall biosynthesis